MGGKVIFVSHQWMAWRFPDPNFVQLGTLQEALKNLIAGKIQVESDIATQFLDNKNVKVSPGEFQDQDKIFIWYDYFSCPQIHARASDESKQSGEDLQKAVDSIPAYVELSDYFVIVTPT